VAACIESGRGCVLDNPDKRKPSVADQSDRFRRRFAHVMSLCTTAYRKTQCAKCRPESYKLELFGMNAILLLTTARDRCRL
jgi:hypothetical protein